MQREVNLSQVCCRRYWNAHGRKRPVGKSSVKISDADADGMATEGGGDKRRGIPTCLPPSRGPGRGAQIDLPASADEAAVFYSRNGTAEYFGRGWAGMVPYTLLLPLQKKETESGTVCMHNLDGYLDPADGSSETKEMSTDAENEQRMGVF